VTRIRISPAAATLVGAFVVSSLVGARSQPPKDADPSLAPWFESLRQPGTNVGCCAEADCRATDYRLADTPSGYEALVDGKWMAVPKDKILSRVPNPVGRAVVCYLPGMGILCFVRATET
jgi:hypothetical protein